MSELADRTATRVLGPVLFALVALALWEIYCAASGVSEALLPRPTEVASALFGRWDELDLGANALITLQEILIGLAVAALIGIAAGTLVRSSRIVERALYPWLVASQMIPIPAIAPVFVLWAGFDLTPKILVISLVSFFPIAVGTIDGLRAVDPGHVRLLRSLRANWWRQLVHARFPAAMPFIFAGLKVAVALAVIGAVFAEWVGSSEGLGYLILVLNNATDTVAMFAVITLLAAMGICLFALIAIAQRLLTPWYFESPEATRRKAR